VSPDPRHVEGHLSDRVAWLRAAVLGANDGLLSTASLILGVGAATSDRKTILTAGAAALVAGALAMAVGEYSSVSSQRDTELADIAREREELASTPESEKQELAAIYRKRGLTPDLAMQVAEQLSASDDPLVHHMRDELNLDIHALAQPGQAAGVSATSFSLGALIPVLVVVLLPRSARVITTVVLTLVGLVALGAVGAHLGRAPKGRAALRVLVGGVVALLASTLIGKLTGKVV
jgi:VIT1/CCC1 family predicted Fe2+/Mn2+ transporter